ncbi:Hypothetical_protein [Hexamita inflata]|nr:Hypothetical protein HINF_LOCUS21734 [Hexamita inflata]CAI9934099.1 Hypothetical protein HINF_LOCUS21744 [Hexamita inflata]
MQLIPSLSICYYDMSVEFKKSKFDVEFDSICDFQGSQLNVTLNHSLSGQNLIFSKLALIDRDNEAKLYFTCADLLFPNANCQSVLDQIKTNSVIQVNVSRIDQSNLESYAQFVEYEASLTNTQIGIIAGCSVGAVVLIIVIVCVSIYCYKKNHKRQPLLNVYQNQPTQQYGTMPLPVVPVGTLE